MELQTVMRNALGLLLVAVLAVGPAHAQRADRDPSAVKAEYEKVAGRLDTGGDLMIVANVDGLLEELIGGIVQTVSAAGPGTPETEALRATLEKLPEFLERNGFYAVRGFGMSVVPRTDGLNTVKQFVSRDAEAAMLPLWRGTVGLKQRRLTSLDLLPAETVMARTSAADMKQVWKLVKEGIAELASPGVAAAFETGLMTGANNIGTSVDDIIASLGEEGFFSIQLSTDQTISLPMPGEPVSIPAPALLLGLEVKDDTLSRIIVEQLTQSGAPAMQTQVGEATLHSVAIPVPSPVPIQPTFTTHGGFFLLGTNPDVVSAALGALAEKNGLVAQSAFQAAFGDLPMENSGLIYIDERFGKTLTELQSRLMTANAPDPSQAASLTALMDTLGAKQGKQSCAMVVQNWKSGVLVQGVSSSSGREIVGSLMIAPVGMMAAIAIPSFVKARTTSQHNACINNLRQLDAAKEQWALAENKADGDEPDRAGVGEYIRGGSVDRLQCPRGGTYALNPIGTNPTCSMPGHGMP